ncbi:ethanolamine kinase 2-like [Lineus longissimus]|uniref:ethanolamine kinase 2-like n=1 Tax=Lineus longissimus TaxID=88925 RepID=UPI002B4C9C62
MARRVEMLDTELQADNYRDDALVMLKRIRPKWNSETITFKRMALGFVNTVLHVRDQKDESDAGIIQRIFGEAYTTSALQNTKFPELEKKCVLMLAELGLGPTVQCVFKNGYFSSFLEGKNFEFNGSEHLEDYVIDAIATEIVKWHSPSTAAAAKEIGFDHTKPYTLVVLRSLLETWPNEASYKTESSRKTFREEIPSQSVMLEEVQRIEDMLAEFDTPLVFCHNDLNMSNMIYFGDSGRMIFLDFENAGFNYPAFDIISHIVSSHTGTCVDPTPRMPTDDYILKWIQKYLEKRKARGDIRDFKQKDVRTIFIQAKKTAPVTQFCLALCIIHIATLSIKDDNAHIDFLGIAAARLKYYFNNRDEAWSLQI